MNIWRAVEAELKVVPSGSQILNRKSRRSIIIKLLLQCLPFNHQANPNYL